MAQRQLLRSPWLGTRSTLVLGPLGPLVSVGKTPRASTQRSCRHRSDFASRPFVDPDHRGHGSKSPELFYQPPEEHQRRRERSSERRDESRRRYERPASSGQRDFANRPAQRLTGLKHQRPDFHQAKRAAYEFPQGHTVSLRSGTVKTTLSSLLLRDLCSCPLCIDPSTKQKLFSTAEIPANIEANQINFVELGTKHGEAEVVWKNDIPGLGDEHVSRFDAAALAAVDAGNVTPLQSVKEIRRVFWNSEEFAHDVPDIEYESYMSDHNVLLKALKTLRSHGLVFLTGVPDSEAAVADITTRIGPLKNTFYGSTWDVRSVPQAKNVAYTSQDLGFHMDLLYTHQAPHLQFLHCIRSSSVGGASLFTDSFRAAARLFERDPEAFQTLTSLVAAFHYNHPDSHYYYRSRRTIEIKHQISGGLKDNNLKELKEFNADPERRRLEPHSPLNIENWINYVNWSPPFQAPFPAPDNLPNFTLRSYQPPAAQRLSVAIEKWHAAAQKFNTIIHEESSIVERMMRPGECVIFDNRRVLHARRAFEVGDAGKERWLRGAYLDKDPYLSKLAVLQMQLGSAVQEIPATEIAA